MPQDWNFSEEDEVVVIEKVATQQSLVKQIAAALERHESMVEVAAHLKESAQAMEWDNYEARQINTR